MVKKYKVCQYKHQIAFPFKIGKYTSEDLFDRTPIKVFHCSIKENSIVEAYPIVKNTIFGNVYDAWLIYSEYVNGTWLSSQSPDKMEWLVPYVENYPKIWGELNI